MPVEWHIPRPSLQAQHSVVRYAEGLCKTVTLAVVNPDMAASDVRDALSVELSRCDNAAGLVMVGGQFEDLVAQFCWEALERRRHSVRVRHVVCFDMF